jgi:hypothetical protein
MLDIQTFGYANLNSDGASILSQNLRGDNGVGEVVMIGSMAK